MITSKGVGAAPQYTLRIKEWKTDAPVAADALCSCHPGREKGSFGASSAISMKYRKVL